ncbi:MAG: NADH-quinone oxidoreductase subunit I [Calditrichia bacterium]
MIKFKKIERPQLTWKEKIYFIPILKGMWITLRHMLGEKYTMEYPEERWIPRTTEDGKGYRGAHRLNKDEQGRIKCVACEMCASACPANCIHIIGMESEWEDREKIPAVFEIDMLRCIYCGMCEEACPKDAIQLTEVYDFADDSRDKLVWDKEKLLEMYDLTKDNDYNKKRAKKAIKE